MRFDRKDPPREFAVGASAIRLRDCGSIALDPDEQVTFIVEGGAEYDVTRKDWGFYATPSLNGRLESFGLRGVLIRNVNSGRYFVLLVQRGHEPAFETYCRDETLEIVAWLDNTEALDQLRERLRGR